MNYDSNYSKAIRLRDLVDIRDNQEVSSTQPLARILQLLTAAYPKVYLEDLASWYPELIRLQILQSIFIKYEILQINYTRKSIGLGLTRYTVYCQRVKAAERLAQDSITNQGCSSTEVTSAALCILELHNYVQLFNVPLAGRIGINSAKDFPQAIVNVINKIAAALGVSDLELLDLIFNSTDF